MEIRDWYKAHFEDRLSGRYITLDHLLPLLDFYRDQLEISSAGTSENGLEIPMIQFGHGEKKVLAWSQMHGNESTTTKAVFDLFRFVTQKKSFQKEVDQLLFTYRICIIPMLNPDGALLYTRENANKIDLNRDAQALSQSESRVLRGVFDSFQPDLCLNLHDQRTIYGLSTGHPATVSFLAPAADAERSITPSRKVAMADIVRMNGVLQRFIPGCVGRYDDGFNADCVGDTFPMTGVPTILFEAGHFPGDYKREKTREMIFYAFLSLFGCLEETAAGEDFMSYFEIPENQVNFKDILLTNIRLAGGENQSIAIQFEEILAGDVIRFQPVIDQISDLEPFFGHTVIEGGGAQILINHQEKVAVGDNVSTIVDKNDDSSIIFSDI